MLIFWFSFLILIIWSIWAIWLVRRDYQNHRVLSPFTTTVVWILYAFYFGVEFYAAWSRYWQIQVGSPMELIVPGALVIVVGTIIYALGILHLRTFRRMSGRDTSEFIQTGIYRWSRNPQNLGWELVLIGIGLISRSGMALLLALAFWFLFIVYVPIEERYLESVYGDEYRRYKTNSHRYFGFPR